MTEEMRAALLEQIAAAGPQALAGMLDLEPIEADLFRAAYVFDEPFALYGGQVLAQSLVAAGRTVDPSRRVHSLHGYFLRPGDALRPTVFQVFRDRDGRSYSARRVIAIQRGEVILNMSCSFSTTGSGPVHQDVSMPDISGPRAPLHHLPRLFSFEIAHAEGASPSAYPPERFWARCTAELGDDPLLHAAALTYVSDISSGLVRHADDEGSGGSSLDHALWFHEPVRAGAWLLHDLIPQRTGSGRGLYAGHVFSADGHLVATLAQETLFGRPR
ncbi:MAG: acyl-CoA thioesterase domain-containing protein [Tetrasphaera sp.]